MNFIDRMGGFVQAQIINVADIDTFQVVNNQCRITPKNDADFITLPHMRGGITPDVSVTNTKAGFLHIISLQIHLRHLPETLKIKPYQKYIAICRNPMGVDYVFGTPRFPLAAHTHPIFSPRASGATGQQLVLSGSQPGNPLNLVLDN